MATIYYTASSLDGFLATPDHSLAWLFEVEHTPEIEASMGEFFAGVGAIALGSSTYEWLLREERYLERPEAWREQMPQPAWVFTHRDLPVVPGADLRLTSAPVDQVHAEMVAAAGERDVWLMGGGDLVGQFADARLLDRVVVTFVPVTLGAGAPLLPRYLRSDRLTLESVASVGQFATLTYAVR